MKKLDLYIFKKFLGTFFFSITLIIMIVIVFDISEKIEDFIKKDAPLKVIIVDYYFNFIPYFVNLFSPLFTFIAVIFFTSRLAARTEIVAILSSGISFKRFLLPYLLGASVLAVLSLYLNNSLIPQTNKTRLRFENTYINNPYRIQEVNIHRQIEPNTYVYVERFNNEDNTGFKFALEKFENGKLKYKLMAENVKYDTLTQQWRINKYFERQIGETLESMKTGEYMDMTLNLAPKDFGRRINNIETMNHTELNTFIKEEKAKGSGNIEIYELEKYRRIATPFSTFILTLIGVSLASRKVRGGIGLHIGLGLLISFSYILFMQVSNTFAIGGLIAPIVAVWIPNILYGILGAFLFMTAPK